MVRNRKFNGSTPTFISVLMNDEHVFHWPTEIAKRLSAMDNAVLPAVLINNSASADHLTESHTAL